MNGPMNIVTACDDFYVQHTAVFLKSLLKQHRESNLRVFVLVPNDFCYCDTLQRNIGCRRTTLEFLTVNAADTGVLKISNRITATTYFKLFLDKAIQDDINRVIYLDGDILVTSSLGKLWAEGLDDNIIAAVVDAGLNADICIRQKISLSPTSHYFNAGVLLIDLDRWRAAKVGERALTFARNHPELITMEDQCALNHVIGGKFKRLKEAWNFQTNHLRWDAEGTCNSDSLRELYSAKIVHFTSHPKPWCYVGDHPMKWLYWELLRETEWRDYRPPDRTALNLFKRSLAKRAPALLRAVREVRNRWRPTMN
jgi:UDP-glucose/galactose:(glucosyl)LPS alpha-1,2-glucosyl/galactosyltransferase